MALPDVAKLGIGTPIILGNAAAHNESVAAVNNLGNVTDEIDCSNLAAQAARQSDKFDFGEFFDLQLVFGACVEWETSPEVSNVDSLFFYLAFSNSATAANANPGAVSGVDGAYTGYSASALTGSLRHLTSLGGMQMDNVINTDQAQIMTNIFTFTPRMRYASLIVFNSAVSAALHSDMVETSFIFQPLVTSIRDS